MDSFGEIVKALTESPSPAMLVLALLSLAYMYRENREREKAHLETAMQIAPLASKLSDAIGALERITAKVLERKDD